MLVLTRKVGESLLLGEQIEVKIIETVGDKVKVGITAPETVRVLRKELLQTIEENQRATQGVHGPELLRDLLGRRE